MCSNYSCKVPGKPLSLFINPAHQTDENRKEKDRTRIVSKWQRMHFLSETDRRRLLTALLRIPVDTRSVFR